MTELLFKGDQLKWQSCYLKGPTEMTELLFKGDQLKWQLLFKGDQLKWQSCYLKGTNWNDKAVT
jgi:hypothetical protein